MGSKQVVTTKLSDLCELIVDCPHSTPEWTDSGFIVLRNQNIRNGSLDLSSPSFTDENGYNSRIKRAVPKAGDIVLTREAPMGEVCLIPEGLQCCLGQRQVLLRPMKGVSGEYLFWALQSPFVRHQISWSEGTGTTVSNIRIPVLKAFEIPRWFENEPQIASHLSAIKNKITLNQKTNQTLEQMAQALFKSWFVDFDPVVDNALDAGFFEQELPFSDELLRRAETRRAVRERGDFQQLPEATRQLFPAAFEECVEPSLGLGGWVPQGWCVRKLENLMELAYGKALKSTDRIDGHVPVYGSGGITGYHNAPLVDGPSIIVGRKGTVGSLYWEDRPFFPIDTVFYVRSEKPLTYCFSLLQTLGLTDMNTDAAVPGLNRNNAYRLQVITPNDDVLNAFDIFAVTLRQRIFANTEQMKNLTNLRDTLLPKLISGELRLDNIEADLAKVEVA